MKTRQLKHELRRAKASEVELDNLVALAEKLDTITPPGLSAAGKQRIANRLPVSVELEDKKPLFVGRMRLVVLSSIGGLATVALIVSTLAHFAAPISPVHDVKPEDKKTHGIGEPAPNGTLSLPEAPTEKAKPLEESPVAPEEQKQTEQEREEQAALSKLREAQENLKRQRQAQQNQWQSPYIEKLRSLLFDR